MKAKKIVYILLLSSLAFFLLGFSLWNPSHMSPEQKINIERLLSPLSVEEKKEMEDVFTHLFFFDQFLYPIFGTKPMSIGRLPPSKKSEIGWNAWKKIAPSSKNFVIRESTLNGAKIAIVANLKEVEKAYQMNQDAFLSSFNGRMKIEDLFECLKTETPLFQELIHCDLALGILLGYGRRNSELYTKNQHLPKEKQETLEPFSSRHPIFYSFSPAIPIYFACDSDSEETKELKKRYTQERNSIIKLSKQKKLFYQMLVNLSKNED